MNKTLMITGSYPPDICGVGDYTYQLLQTDIGQQWDLYYSRNWSIFSLLKHVRNINKFHPTNIIMQYPTLGYGWSIVPHLLCLYYSIFTRIKFGVILHEFSQQTKKSRITIFFILFVANKIIFTNKYEQDYASTFLKNIKRKSGVVKIYSNILSGLPLRPIEIRKFDLIYFGHVRPNKGIEDFIKTAKTIKSKYQNYKIAIAGQVPKGFEQYFSSLKLICDSYGIDIILNQSNNEVADFLNNAKIAYLPFPDGVSERRGSFLAALKNGVVVITKSGIFTTEALKKCILISDNTIIAEEQFIYLLENESTMYQLQKQGFNFLDQEMPLSWDQVISMIEKTFNKC